LAAVTLAAQLGCGRVSQPGREEFDRILITHTENLSGDPALDGAARVISHLVRSQLSGSRTVAVFEAPHEADASQRRAGRIVRSWLEVGSGRLILHVTLRSASNKTLEQWQDSAARTDGASALADALAKHIVPQAPAAQTLPAEAAARFGDALMASPENSIAILRQLAPSVPSWGDPYYLLGANLAAAGKPAEALDVWKEGRARASDEVSRARMDLGIAAAMKQPEALVEANERLAALLPSEPEVAIQAGEARLARGDFAKAVTLMKSAVEREPGVGLWWNRLAFAQAFAGDATGALDSIRHYGQLDPGSGNPADSLGEIQFLLGRFRESAASFQEAFGKEPSLLGGATLYKSAQAFHMAGDERAAGLMFERYLNGPLKSSPVRELTRLRWDYQAGNRDQAINQATAVAQAPGTSPDASALLWAQIAWWNLVAGNRPQALDAAKAGMRKAQSPPARRDVLLMFYLAQPSASVDEWRRRANGNPPDDVLAFALLFDHKWKDALPVLSGLIAKTHPFQAGHWRVLYAWALTESGDAAKAREWLKWYPIPLASGGDTIEPLVMAKALELRKR
jgi:tetratricopeptide (TPR) repeat protein